MTRPTRTPPNLPGTRYLVAVANERESKRWNDDQWVASWPDRERLTEALSAYLLRDRPMRVPASGCATSGVAAVP